MTQLLEKEEAAPVISQKATSRKTRGLSRAAWHFIVDVFLLVTFLLLVWTSSVVQFIFPAPDQAAGWSLWGYNYTMWSDLRFASLCLFSLVVLVHLMLQWNWIFVFVTSRWSKIRGHKIEIPRAARTLYGVCLLIGAMTLLGTLYAIAQFCVQMPKVLGG